ncbi:MAG TPA: DUF4199 domain-containing protein [Thermoanaerobaculia bacterium]|jgi:hypothetical protein
MKKTVLRYGLISGAVVSGLLLLTMPFHDAIGFETAGLLVGYTTMVLAFLLIYFGVRSYRDKVAGGTVRFGRAFVVGALIGLVSSLCYVATWEVVYFQYMPDFMDKYGAHVIEKARASGENEAALAKRKAEMEEFAEQYKNPAFNAAVTLMEPLPVALLVSLITAAVLSRRPPSGGAAATTTG